VTGLARAEDRIIAVRADVGAISLAIALRADRALADAAAVGLVADFAICGIARRGSTGAGAVLTGIAAGAEQAIVTRCPVCLGGIGADAGCGIAGADIVALVGSSADDGISANASAAHAGVGLRAGIAVIAACAIGGIGIRADAGGRIACARIMALIERRADCLGAAGTDTSLAGVA